MCWPCGAGSGDSVNAWGVKGGGRLTLPEAETCDIFCERLGV
jgi:hypothetical protein